MELRHHVTDTPQKVFVYGTLKRGNGNWNHYLKADRMLGIADVEGILFHAGGYPALNLDEKFVKVQGEVYEVTWPKIISLDGLEGVPHHYQRREITIPSYGKVWTYVYPYDRAKEMQWCIPSGNWRGQMTPKVRWNGFGKGVAVGSFQSDMTRDEISIGGGEGPFVLKRNVATGTYLLVNTKTGETAGEFTHLRDRLMSDGTLKPVLKLPMKLPAALTVPPTASTVGKAVVPITTIPLKPVEPPNAMKNLLGLKVREA